MLETIWKKILRRERLSLYAIPAFVLWVLSLFYRVAAAIHRMMNVAKIRVDVPVICVGNITVGGSGKTPIVAFLGRRLLNDGHRVGIVSSGYGRESHQPILEFADHIQKMATSETGDEVKLLAGLLPEAVFSVAVKKAEAARRLAVSGKVDVIIVDDGFQHGKLTRDVDIVTYDGGIENRLLRLFPYGALREPISALKRADVIIVTRSKFAKDMNSLYRDLGASSPRAHLYAASFSADQLIGRKQTLPIEYLKDKSIFLFAGVGNFRALERQVTTLCGGLNFALELDDHQLYSEALLNRIKSMADGYNSDLILTTGKDWVKIGDFDFGRQIYYLNQTVDLDPAQEKLITYLRERLNLKRQTG